MSEDSMTEARGAKLVQQARMIVEKVLAAPTTHQADEVVYAELATLHAEHDRLRADYDKVLTAWAESRARHLAAESSVQALRQALEGWSVKWIAWAKQPPQAGGQQTRQKSTREVVEDVVYDLKAALALPGEKETK